MKNISTWITEVRFEEYLMAANQNYDDALELYKWNTEISGALYELLNYVEVSIRNAVDKELKKYEPATSATINVKDGWWFRNPAFLNSSELKYSETALSHLRNQSADKEKNASRDKVLASTTFGLWEAIFTKEYESIFRNHLVYAFPNRHETGLKTRAAYLKRISALRLLRNRIAHHQPIFHLPLEERYVEAIELITSIDSEYGAWVANISRVKELLDTRPPAGPEMVAIVPAKDAWSLYEKLGVYICQPGRTFQTVSHIGFYSDHQLHPHIAKVKRRIDNVKWTPDEIERLFSEKSEASFELAKVIRESRNKGWTHFDKYQVFFLTTQPEEIGHEVLPEPLTSSRRGRGSAWVRKQRYATLSKLREAKTLSDLD